MAAKRNLQHQQLPNPASVRAGNFMPETAARLDQLIHERLRLGIVSALAAGGSLGFKDLKSVLGTTDGNLSVHARKLEDAGYITCTKTFADRIPHTEYRLTPLGRRAFDRYLAHMEALIQAARSKKL
jgi:DNA-binding HxlR family transcriptional regulator